jgi:hypothetical protein
MKIIEISTRRRVTVAMFILGIVLFGFVCAEKKWIFIVSSLQGGE